MSAESIDHFQRSKGKAAGIFNKVAEPLLQLRQIGPDIGGALAEFFTLVANTIIVARQKAKQKAAGRAEQKAAQIREQDLLNREAAVSAREASIKGKALSADDPAAGPEAAEAAAAGSENSKADNNNRKDAETINPKNDEPIDVDFRVIEPEESASRDIIIPGMGRNRHGSLRGDTAAGAAKNSQSDANPQLPGRPKLLPPPSAGADLT